MDVSSEEMRRETEALKYEAAQRFSDTVKSCENNEGFKGFNCVKVTHDVPFRSKRCHSLISYRNAIQSSQW